MPQQHAVSAPRPCILMVEDEVDFREPLAEFLHEEGYHVVQARNGLHALQLLQAGVRPALVLLDMMMPIMDGPTFLRHLRAEPAWSALPVLIVSGSRPAPGAVAVLKKPFELPVLTGLLARHCPRNGSSSAAVAALGAAG